MRLAARDDCCNILVKYLARGRQYQHRVSCVCVCVHVGEMDGDIHQTIKCNYEYWLTVAEVLDHLSPHLRPLTNRFRRKFDRIYIGTNDDAILRNQQPMATCFEDQKRIIEQFVANDNICDKVNLRSYYGLFNSLIGSELARYVTKYCSVYAMLPSSNYMILVSGKNLPFSWKRKDTPDIDEMNSSWTEINHKVFANIFHQLTGNNGDLIQMASDIFEECRIDEHYRCLFMLDGKVPNINRVDLLYSRNSSGRTTKTRLLPRDGDGVAEFIATSKRAMFGVGHLDGVKLDQLLTRIYHNYRQCNLNSLLKHCCALPDDYRNDLRHQQEQPQPTLSLRTPRKQLFKFIFALYRFIFPIDTFGSKGNFRKFYENLKSILTANYATKFRIWDIVNGLKLAEMEPLFADIVRSSLKEKKVIFFLCWAYEFIQTIVKCKFYVTESANLKYELLFYRYDVWARIGGQTAREYRKLGIWHVSRRPVVAVPTVCRDSLQYLKYSRYRLIPKKRGVRPITRLRYSHQSKQFKPKVAVLLSLLRKLNSLSAVDTTDPASHRSDSNLYQKVLIMKQTNPATEGKYYMIRGDFQDCYQSIRLEKMEYILYKMIYNYTRKWKCDRVKYGAYPLPVVMSFTQIELTRKNRVGLTRRTEYVLTPPAYHCSTDFRKLNLVLRKQLGEQHLAGSVIRSVQTLDLPTSEIVKVLRDYLHGHRITLGGQTECTFRCGLRQGGPLSALLCDLYLNYLWDKYFAKLIKSNGNIFTKFVDDFLFITANFEEAKKFLQIIENGFEEMNMRINQSKLMVNFDIGTGMIDERAAPPTPAPVNYLGRSLYTDLSFGIDLRPFVSIRITDTFNCNLFQPVINAMRCLIGNWMPVIKSAIN